jgi:hypothetical protein
VVGRERSRSPLCLSPQVKPGVRISRTGLPRTHSPHGDVKTPDGVPSAEATQTTLGFCFALAAIFSSCVDIVIQPLRAGNVSLLKPLVLLPCFPMDAASPRAEHYQGIRLPPQRLPASGWSFQSAYSALWPRPRWISQGPLTLPSPCVPCPSTPPDSPAAFACTGCLLLAFPVFERVGVRSFLTRLVRLHSRYGPRVALSTLHSCRSLHAPKPRFPVGWLAPCRGGHCTRWTRRALPGAPK